MSPYLSNFYCWTPVKLMGTTRLVFAAVCGVGASAAGTGTGGTPCATAANQDCSFASSPGPRTSTYSHCCPGGSGICLECSTSSGGTIRTCASGSVAAGFMSGCADGGMTNGEVDVYYCYNSDDSPFTPTCNTPAPTPAPTPVPTPAPTPRTAASARGGLCWDATHSKISRHCKVPCLKWSSLAVTWEPSDEASSLFDPAKGAAAGYCCDYYDGFSGDGQTKCPSRGQETCHVVPASVGYDGR
jgi:hypothetical protein